MKEYVVNKDVVFEVIYVIGQVNNAKIEDPEKYRFFISKDLLYNPKGYDLSLIIGNDEKNLIYEPISCTEFQKTYPEVKLKEFLESGGRDAVRFILANNNDTLFELIGKAGLGYIAEESDKMELNRNGKNLKEIFGYLSFTGEERLLDIGCGKGVVLLEASAYPFQKVAGIDIDERLLIVARKNFQILKMEDRVECIQANACRSSFCP